MKSRYSPLWSILSCLALLCPCAAFATPGLRPKIGASTLEAFLRDDPQSAAYFPRRRAYATPTAQLLDAETPYRLKVFRDLGGMPYGLPMIIDLGEFARYKFRNDAYRLAQERLGSNVNTDGDGEGLIDVKIPFRVPKRLSAITGEGETNLTIRGRRRIELSGVSQYTLGEAQAATARTSRFPTINFEQDAQLTVEGNIGDRITVSLEQNSAQNFNLTDGLRLQYKGDEDSIIETIEAGSTSLTLPGTRLIGFSGGNRGGLFGIKTRSRVGAVNFTVVTSQDKASSDRKTFTGQAEESSSEINDYRYIQNMYFFIDEFYRENFRNGLLPAPNNRVNVQSVRVFINDFNAQNDLEDSAIPGVAYVSWNNGSPDEAGSRRFDKGVEEGTFHELSPSDFTVLPEGYLIHERGPVSQGYTLAVAYQTAAGATFGDIQFIQSRAIQTKKFGSSSSRPGSNAPRTRRGNFRGAMSILSDRATSIPTACSWASFSQCRAKIRRTIRKATHTCKFLASTGTPMDLPNPPRRIRESTSARAMKSPVSSFPEAISCFPFSSRLANRAWARPTSRCACRISTRKPIPPTAPKPGVM